MLDNLKNPNEKYNDIINQFKKNDFESVIEKIKILEEDTFENPFLMNLLGASYLKLNDTENAKLYFNYALDIDENYKSSIINLANIEYKNNSYQSAFDYYSKLFKDNTPANHAEYLGNMGNCLFHLGHLEDGITLCEEAIKIDPKCETPYFQLAEMMRHNGDPEAIISYYYKCLEENPDSYKTYYCLGSYFKGLKCFNMALKFFNKCISINKNYLEAIFQKSEIYSKIGQYEQSIKTLKEIVDLDNQNSRAFNLIGMNLEKLNLNKEAKERYLDAIYLDPENSDAYYNLGSNLIKSNNLADALECLQKNQRISPNSKKRYDLLDKINSMILDYYSNKKAKHQLGLIENNDPACLEKIISKLEIDIKNISVSKIFEKIYPLNSSFDENVILDKSNEPICLLGLDRSGSLFFQSHFDGHPEISTLPGYFFKGWFNQNTWPFFEPNYSELNWRENLADLICAHFEPQFNANSRKNLIGIKNEHSGWLAKNIGFTELGEESLDVFELDQEKFKQAFVDIIMPFEKIDSQVCFEAINNAFDKAYRKNNSNSNRILFHLHTPSQFERSNFHYHYPNSKTIFMVRNPIEMLESQIINDLEILNTLSEDKNSFFDDDTFYNLLKNTNKIISILEYYTNPINSFSNIRGIRLEDIKSNPKKIIPSITNWIGIKNDPCLFASNFLGYNFTSKSVDLAVSAQYDKRKNDPKIGRLFHSRDIKILETLFWPFMSLYGYTKMSEKEFDTNLDTIKPWLEEPFKFEIDICGRLPEDTPDLNKMTELSQFRTKLISFWEYLKLNKTYPHIVKPL